MEFNQGHQGDVFFRKISEESFLEAKRNEIKTDTTKGKTVLQGEATNHYHQFREPEKVNLFFAPSNDNGIVRMVAEVKEQTELQHYHIKRKELTKEHKSIQIPAGFYEFRSQRMSSLDSYILPVAD